MSHIEVNGLSKVFGRHPQRGLELAREGVSKDDILAQSGQILAVSDVSFDVEQGEMFIVMGLSGSGKSTVVRMLNRLIDPTAGSVVVDGEPISEMSRAHLREVRAQKMSMVFQHFALFPHRTVGDNAAYGLKIQGVDQDERRERAEGAMERVGLTGWFDKYPHEMSGGMKQRVGIARGLATDADILLMDEPFSALDPLIRRDMQDLLMELQAELARTVVFITHDLNEAMRLGDRIAVMKDGAIVQIGTGEQIIHDPATEYVANFVADVDRSRVLTASLAMRKPRRTFSPTASPQEVLAYLDEVEHNGVYVVDDDNFLVGVARDDRLAAAVRDGAPTIEGVLVDAYATANPDTLLMDMSAVAAQHSVPIAVRDEHGHFKGVVPRPALLRALAGEQRMGRADPSTANQPAASGATPSGGSNTTEEVTA